MAENKPSKYLGSVEKTIKILDALRDLNSAGVTEIAEYLNLPKTTIHPYLLTLEHNEFIVKKDDQYHLSLKFISYGEYIKRQDELFDIIPEEIDRLSEETNELANYLVEEHGRGVYLYQSRSNRGVQTRADIGFRRPLHCTGVGKAILAYLPEKRVDDIIDKHGLTKMTENTITDRDELMSELEEIRKRGYAIDDEEIQRGLRCVAAPILNDRKEVLGGISVASPTGRLKGDRFEEELPEKVMNTANVIEVNARNSL